MVEFRSRMKLPENCFLKSVVMQMLNRNKTLGGLVTVPLMIFNFLD